MSDYETWTGTAKVIKPNEGENFEALCQRICEEKGFKKSEYHESFQETIESEAYKEMAIVDEILYDVSGMSEDSDDGDICEGIRIDPDTVNVTLRFYNGGTCFPEMFEAAVQKLSKYPQLKIKLE